MNLEEMLEDIQATGGTLAGVEASTDIKIEKEETPVVEEEKKEKKTRKSKKEEVVEPDNIFETCVLCFLIANH